MFQACAPNISANHVHFMFLGQCLKPYLFSSDAVDRSGQIAVVTGGSRGLGLHVVRMLLQCNMHVIIGKGL